MPWIDRTSAHRVPLGVLMLSVFFFGIMCICPVVLVPPPLQKENHVAICQISKRSVIRFVIIFLKKRPFGLKTRTRKHILYCSKSEQCHCEQEKKQKLRKKTKRLRGSQPDRDAAQASSRPQLRTRLKPKHSAGAVENTKYRFDQTYSIPNEMRSTR